MKLSKIFSREYSVQYTEVSLRSLGREMRSILPALVLSQTYIPEQQNEACFVELPEWHDFLKTLEEKYKNKSILKNFYARFHRAGEQYVQTAKNISLIDLEALSGKKLAQHYKNYQKNLIYYTAHLWMGYCLNNIYSDNAKKMLLAKGLKNVDTLLAPLLAPIKRSGILILHDELTRLKKEKRRVTEEVMAKILKRYAWVSCLDIHNDPWTRTELQALYTDLKASGKPLPFAKTARNAHLNKVEKEYFMRTRELAYIKDMRDVYRREGVYSALPLFKEIAHRLKVDRKELAYFTFEELAKALEKGAALSFTVAAKRQKGFLIYSENKNIKVVSEPTLIKRFIEANVVSLKQQKGAILKGIVASKGSAQGEAKIVLTIKDLAKVKEGDIIIAITTHPDFLPAMHRAAAIVTDEGGVTSHAAIVARELKKPCLVATHRATQMFKDFEMVKVDANEGTISLVS